MIWTPFKYATSASLFFWGVLIMFLLKSTALFTYVPDFTWGCLLVWTVLNVLFPMTMYNHYTQTDKFANFSSGCLRYVEAEKTYSKLALVGRTLFVWLVLIGCQN